MAMRTAKRLENLELQQDRMRRRKQNWQPTSASTCTIGHGAHIACKLVRRVHITKLKVVPEREALGAWIIDSLVRMLKMMMKENAICLYLLHMMM